jgi:acyl-CoA reductase-like NAD-dependent aldehyde dehydrogenase
MATVELAREQLLIGGSWTDADGGRTFEQMFPYTGESVGSAAAAGRADARAAVDAAHGAFAEWGRSTPGERRTILTKAARPTG